jgi:hypothetical protein
MTAPKCMCGHEKHVYPCDAIMDVKNTGNHIVLTPCGCDKYRPVNKAKKGK